MDIGPSEKRKSNDNMLVPPQAIRDFDKAIGKAEESKYLTIGRMTGRNERTKELETN